MVDFKISDHSLEMESVIEMENVNSLFLSLHFELDSSFLISDP